MLIDITDFLCPVAESVPKGFVKQQKARARRDLSSCNALKIRHLFKLVAPSPV